MSMALTGVLRPGHAQLRVTDLDRAVHFYRDVLGLVETGRDAADRVYFKTWDERDHNSVILREADTPGVDHFAFKVRDNATLERLEGDLRGWGAPIEQVPAGEMLATGRRIRFEIPSGHRIELYAVKQAVPYAGQLQNPRPWTPAAEHGIAPIRMDHALFYGPRVNDNLALFTEVLGFYLTEYVTLPDGETKGALWLSCSIKAHDIAFVEHAEPGRLHHVSFLLDSWEKILRAGDIMSMNKVPVEIGPTRHGITRGMTIYGFDPSGNRFETFCGGLQSYPDQAPIAWSWDELPSGLDYPQRKLHETFLSVVT
jgi:catechol 2,3-dioxygenase